MLFGLLLVRRRVRERVLVVVLNAKSDNHIVARFPVQWVNGQLDGHLVRSTPHYEARLILDLEFAVKLGGVVTPMNHKRCVRQLERTAQPDVHRLRHLDVSGRRHGHRVERRCGGAGRRQATGGQLLIELGLQLCNVAELFDGARKFSDRNGHIVHSRIDELDLDLGGLASLERVVAQQTHFGHMIAGQRVDAILDRVRIELRLDDVMIAFATAQRAFDGQRLVVWMQIQHGNGLDGRIVQALPQSGDAVQPQRFLEEMLG